MADNSNRCGDDCICCYYGGWTALPLVLAWITLVLSWAYTFSCHFWSATTIEGYPYDLGLWEFEYFTPDDIWTYRETGTMREVEANEFDCVYLADHPYLDLDDPNTHFKLARVMGIFVCVLGFFTLDFLLCLACCRCHVGVIRFFMVMQILFGIMTLLVLTSRGSTFCKEGSSCSLAGAGVVCILTSFLWIGSAASLAILKPAKMSTSDGSMPVNAVEMTGMPSTQPTLTAGNGMSVTVPTTSPVVYPGMSAYNNNNVPMTQISTENRVQSDGSIIQVTLQTITHPDGSQTTVMLNQVPLGAAAGQRGALSPDVPIVDAKVIMDEKGGKKSL